VADPQRFLIASGLTIGKHSTSFINAQKAHPTKDELETFIANWHTNPH
jgi:hypothetical protein